LEAQRAPGRPRDPAKQQAILDAAKSIILEVGLDAAAIESIAASAGVSKATVYRHFGDKPALFVALVERETGRILEELSALPHGKGRLPDRLEAFGRALTAFALAPSQLALDAMLAKEAFRHPQLARQFFAAGPERLRSALASLLSEAVSAGEIRVGDVDAAAGHLIALLLGFEAVRLRFLPADRMSPSALRTHVADAVRVFLRAYGRVAP
jgi:TetR/AcrR family transcriptional repressor of mexJK operon